MIFLIGRYPLDTGPKIETDPRIEVIRNRPSDKVWN